MDKNEMNDEILIARDLIRNIADGVQEEIEQLNDQNYFELLDLFANIDSGIEKAEQDLNDVNNEFNSLKNQFQELDQKFKVTEYGLINSIPKKIKIPFGKKTTLGLALGIAAIFSLSQIDECDNESVENLANYATVIGSGEQTCDPQEFSDAYAVHDAISAYLVDAGRIYLEGSCEGVLTDLYDQMFNNCPIDEDSRTNFVLHGMSSCPEGDDENPMVRINLQGDE